MYSMPIRSSTMMIYLAMVLEVLVVISFGDMTYTMYGNDSYQTDVPKRYELLSIAAALLLLCLSFISYRSWRANKLSDMLRSIVFAWLTTCAAMAIWMFFSKSAESFSRVWFASWGLSTLVVLVLLRIVVYSGVRFLRTLGYNFKNLVLVGDEQSGLEVSRALANEIWSDLKVVARILPMDLAQWLAENTSSIQIDEVWLCLPLSDQQGILEAKNALRYSTANIRLVPDWFALKIVNHGVSEIAGIPMLDLSATPVTGVMRIIKAVEDRVLACAILLLISPLLLIIAVAVKASSPGPVLFKQLRHGWNGDEIEVWKFRSMFVHTEDGGTVTQATKNDNRITKLGAFLRRTSLDELPQFFNVLQGGMSIVGPRPHALAHNEHYKHLIERYMLRHKVKPGITGWAQIHGYRGETDTLDKMQKRVEFDLYYIENMSLWLDLKIVVATAIKGFVQPNAY